MKVRNLKRTWINVGKENREYTNTWRKAKIDRIIPKKPKALA